MKEIWKPIIYKNIDYSCDYSVSNMGRVKSFKNGKSTILKIRKQGRKGNDYNCVNLRKDGIPRSAKVSILVWEAFMFKRKSGYVIHHIDSDRFNNKLENLAHITHRENCSIEKTIKSGLPIGVSYYKRDNNFTAQIQLNGVIVALGRYKSISIASSVYQIALKEVEGCSFLTRHKLLTITSDYREKIGLKRIKNT